MNKPSGGHGIVTSANGDVDVIEGEFKDGERNGHGNWTSANRDVFEGEFTNGKRNGHGAVTYPNGAVFKCEYKDGLRHGPAKYTHAHGAVFECRYTAGVLSNVSFGTHVQGAASETGATLGRKRSVNDMGTAADQPPAKQTFTERMNPCTPAQCSGNTDIGSILSSHNLRSLDVGGGGDCQFRSIAHHLFGDAEKHPEVRAVVVREMLDRPEKYVDFCEQWDLDGEANPMHHCTWAEYLAKMGKIGEWGGNTTLQAASNAYIQTIHVLTTNSDNGVYHITPELEPGSDTDTDDARQPKPHIWIVYLTNNHYSASESITDICMKGQC